MTFATEPNPSEILQQPGYLYWNPSGLDDEENYGTLIGFTQKGVDFDAGMKPVLLQKEETGSEVAYKLFDQEPKVKTVLVSWNNQAIDLLFPGLSNSGTVESPGKTRILPGMDMFDNYSGCLLFVPWNTTSNNIFILQQCSPNIEKSIKFSATTESSYVVVFHAKRKSEDDHGLYYIGPIGSGAIVSE